MPVDFCINCGHPNIFSTQSRREYCCRCSKSISIFAGVIPISSINNSSSKVTIKPSIFPEDNDFFELTSNSVEIENEDNLFEVIGGSEIVENKPAKDFARRPKEKIEKAEEIKEEVVEEEKIPKKRGRKSKADIKREKALEVLSEGK